MKQKNTLSETYTLMNGIQAGMCDEVSVVIAPVADGSSKTPALFNAKDEWASDTPVAFELQSAEIKDGGSVWLRYLVKR